jgi:hypothetical protein
MRVATKDAVTMARAGILQRAFGNFVRQTKPACIHAIQKTREDLTVCIELLNAVKDLLPQPAEQQIAADKAVKLMAVNGQMPLAGVLPHVALIDGNADQVGHQLRQPVVVVALDPDDLHAAARVGELADVAEKLPVVAGQAPEVQIGKDIAEKHQAPEAVALQHIQCIPGAA